MFCEVDDIVAILPIVTLKVVEHIVTVIDDAEFAVCNYATVVIPVSVGRINSSFESAMMIRAIAPPRVMPVWRVSSSQITSFQSAELRSIGRCYMLQTVR